MDATSTICVDRDQHAGRSRQGSESEVAELRRTIDDYDVVSIRHLLDGGSDTPEEEFCATRAAFRNGTRGLMLKLHKFKIARNEPNTFKVVGRMTSRMDGDRRRSG